MGTPTSSVITKENEDSNLSIGVLENRLSQRSASEDLSFVHQVDTLTNPEITEKVPIDSPVHEIPTNLQEDDDPGVPITSLDWDGPQDPDDPKNWPRTRKWVITMTVSGMCLAVTAGSSLYVSGVFNMEAELKSSQTLSISGLTFYLVGLSMGPVLGAPLSELFGRKIVYLISIPISMLFIMGVGLSNHIYQILVLRFFSGLFASPVMAICGGTVSDMWSVDDFGVAMTSFCLAPVLGPVIGPLMGSYAVQAKSWRWTQWIFLMLMGVNIPFIIWMPETYKPAIMRKRAKARGIKIAKPNLTLLGFVKVILLITILRPVQMLFYREPIVIVLSIYTAFIFSILFGFFEAYPVIYSGVYNIQGGNSSLPFIGMGIGLAAGSCIFLYIDRTRFFPKQPDGSRFAKDENGNVKLITAEKTLISAKIGAVLLPISLFWQAWTARRSVQFMAPIAAGVPFGISIVLIYYNVLYYFILSYPAIILASALAANNFARYIMSSVFPLFTVQMYEKLGIDWASSLFGFVSLVLLPIPWVFERYGEKLRSRSYFNNLIRIQEEEKKKAQQAALNGTSKENELSRGSSHNDSAV